VNILLYVCCLEPDGQSVVDYFNYIRNMTLQYDLMLGQTCAWNPQGIQARLREAVGGITWGCPQGRSSRRWPSPSGADPVPPRPARSNLSWQKPRGLKPSNSRPREERGYGEQAPWAKPQSEGSRGYIAPLRRNMGWKPWMAWVPRRATPWVRFAPWGSSGGCLVPRGLLNATDRQTWTGP
jgi:hypothetical protein